MPGVAIYVRISEDKTGEAMGVARQERECRELAERLNLTVDAVHVDNDLSASSGVHRPQFEALLASRPSAIIAWHQDRLLRRGVDLERVIELNVPVYTVTAGTLDLTSPAGRAVARTVAAWSQYEGEQKALRQVAKTRQLVESGLPVPGRRRYGFISGNREAHPEEAADVRRLFADFLSGRSIRSLAIERGWRPGRVRDTLSNPSYAGYVVRGAERFEAAPEVARLVTREDFEAVQSRLASPGRKVTPGPARKHLLSGIAECGVCGGLLNVTAGGYRCAASSAHVFTSEMDVLEMRATIRAWQVIQDRATGDALAPDADQMEAARSELDALASERSRLSGMLTDPDVDASPIRAKLRELRPEIERLEADLQAMEAASVEARIVAQLRRRVLEDTNELQAMVNRSQTVGKEWRALDLDDQRTLIRATVRVVLHRGRGTGRERFEITPR